MCDINVLNSDKVMNCCKFCFWNHISDCRMWLMLLDGCELRVRVKTRGDEYSCEKDMSFGAFEN